jgi:hypothetical protein
MRTDVAANLFTVADLIAVDECRELIERGEAIGFEAASVSTPSGPKMMANVRTNDRVTFEDPILAEWLWQRVKPHVPSSMNGATASGLNERLRIYRYDPSQKFNAHRDGVVELSPTQRSQLTFMAYLNADAEGGQTNFYSEDRVNGIRQLVASIEPRIGMGLFFAHQWWHEGARVIRGRKYVVRTDVIYADPR